MVTDAREWRRLKTLFEVFSDTEENMFTSQTGIIDQSGLKYPQIFMRAKESVHIPFKLQTFLAKIPPSELKTSSNPFAQEQTFSVVEKNYNEKFKTKHIKVSSIPKRVDFPWRFLLGNISSRRRNTNWYSIDPCGIHVTDC